MAQTYRENIVFDGGIGEDALTDVVERSGLASLVERLPEGLESLTEENVPRHLREFPTGRTVIVIAHRLQTVRSADRILVLAGGQAV